MRFVKALHGRLVAWRKAQTENVLSIELPPAEG